MDHVHGQTADLFFGQSRKLEPRSGLREPVRDDRHPFGLGRKVLRHDVDFVTQLQKLAGELVGPLLGAAAKRTELLDHQTDSHDEVSVSRTTFCEGCCVASAPVLRQTNGSCPVNADRRARGLSRFKTSL